MGFNIPRSVINSCDIPLNRLSIMQNKLKLHHGSFKDEFPEQLMCTHYLTGNEKVLELGGNIGRVSMIIASILSGCNNNNYVVLECDKDNAQKLEHNRNLNLFKFHVEQSALSKRPLIQKGWETIVSDKLLEGYKPVNTITVDELNQKYKIEFDTLVIDCEGAFYYILMDMPEILNHIKIIIMENDYQNFDHKKYIDDTLRSREFKPVFSGSGGWGCCYQNFYEVWSK